MLQTPEIFAVLWRSHICVCRSSLHVDAVAVITKLLQEVQEGTQEETYQRWLAAGPKGDIGRSANVVGHNNHPLFMDEEMTLGVSSTTCFVCVACSDQLAEGVGQTMVSSSV
jgi:hypothetical protein